MNALTPSTKLDAVNDMLDSIGERPVNTLEETGRLDVVRAVAVLDRVLKQVLSRGWWFNTEIENSIAVDGSGSYLIPDHVLRIQETNKTSPLNLVFRDGKLYNTKTHTDVGFTDTIEMDYIVSLDFEVLPEVARLYIFLRAGVTFAANRVGAPSVVQFTQSEATEAWKELQREDLENLNANLSDSPDLQKVMSR